ncbi:MAG: FG-GAP repeat domain-containing protein, partial [Candidatus Binatia bacterium]
ATRKSETSLLTPGHWQSKMTSRVSVPLRVLFFVGGILIAPLPSGGLQQTSSQNETIGRVPHAIAVDDFNGDGIPDVAVPAAAERKVAILLSNGMGGFTIAAPLRIKQDIIALSANDFERDGKMDLALVSASHSSVVMLRGDGKGRFSLFERK